jgi:hypothetical protein
MDKIKNTAEAPKRRFGGMTMSAHDAATDFHKNAPGEEKSAFKAVMFTAGEGPARNRRREFNGGSIRPDIQGGRHGVNISDGAGNSFIPNERIQELHFFG